MASEDTSHVQKTSRKRKYDTLSAGPSSMVNSKAPRGISVIEFAEARALELHNMVEGISLGDRTGKKRLFQSIPKHMRRRAMSYNVKRMPVRLREQAKKEMEKNKLDSKTTKKSRRQRRKAKVLLEDYNNRKKQNIWLETHIWHAKRMKMVDAWGYRLAEHPSDKGFRAAHRAVTNNCLLQDISYYGCIEIKGNRKHILSSMSLLTRTELGPSMGSLDGIYMGKEGHVMLYNKNCYPYGAIGPVSFHWRQDCLESINHQNYDTKSSFLVGDNDNTYCTSQLWIWAHPACFDEVFIAITDVCKTVACTSDVDKDGPIKPDNLLATAHEKKHVSGIKNEGITVSSLRHDLARLRLTGPLSHSLLVSMLELPAKNTPGYGKETCSVGAKDSQELFLEQNGEVLTKNEDPKPGCHGNGSSGQVTSNQTEDINVLSPEDIWEGIKSASSPSILPAYSIIALTVIDPRLGMPGIRTSIDSLLTEQQKGDIPPSSSSPDQTNNTSNYRSNLLYTNWPSHTAASSIWDPDTRQRVRETKIEEQKLNEMRSNLLVPGSRLDLGDKTSNVPVLLVQHPGHNGYAAGWDIILPSGWVMAFWMALIYRGARVGGLRENRNCSLEREEPYFPRDVPDTRSGLHYNTQVKTEEESKYNRYPPAKRPNYSKLGMSSPFLIPWSQLVQEWSQLVQEWSLNAQKFKTVLRQDSSTDASLVGQEIDNRTSLHTTIIDNLSSFERRASKNETGNETEDENETGNETEDKNETGNETKDENETETSLAGEDMEQRSGRDDSSSTFFVLRDLSQLRCLRHTMLQTHQSKPSPTRIPHGITDIQPVKDIMTNNPQALIGVSLRMSNKGCPLPNATVSIPSVADLEALKRDMTFGGPVEPLHKGTKQTASKSVAVIGYCTRQVIGFVTSGQYSLSRGFGVGIAYCALPGLVELLTTTNQALVLVRNTKTQQYRLAFIQHIL